MTDEHYVYGGSSSGVLKGGVLADRLGGWMSENGQPVFGLCLRPVLFLLPRLLRAFFYDGI